MTLDDEQHEESGLLFCIELRNLFSFTMDVFHRKENEPEIRLLLNRMHSGLTRAKRHFFNTMLGIESMLIEMQNQPDTTNGYNLGLC